MAWKSVTRQLGLVKSPSPLGVAQEGGLVRADNCVVDADGTVEPRRGFNTGARAINNNGSDERRYNSLHSTSVGATDTIGQRVIGHYGGTTDGGIRYTDDTSAALFTGVGPPDARIRAKFCDSAERCYVTTSAGVKRIDSDGSTTAAAGGLRCFIDATASHPDYDASGFLGVNEAVMYRAVLVTKDFKGREIVGPPSNRFNARVPPSRTTIAPAGAARVSNVTTVTTAAGHGFRVGDAPYMTFDSSDTGANEFTNGEKTIATVPSATTFTFADVAADYTSGAVAATAVLGPAQCKVKVLLPSTASITTILRLYRSENATAAYTATPSEETYLVWEGYLTAAQVAAGYVEVTDNTPELMLGPVAYFAPSQEGDAGANEPPPLAWDVWKQGEVVFYGRPTYPHALELQLFATGNPTGVIAGDTMKFTRDSSNFTITFATSQGTDQAVVYDGVSVARDVEATALALCDAINASTNNTFLDAYYSSAAGENPGLILFRARDYSTTAFTVVSGATGTSCAEAWAPQIPNSGTTVTSKQQISTDGIAWSKPGQPDAVPLLNFARVGQPNRSFCRGLELRDKSVILKEDGAYLISGAYPNYRIDLLDDSCGFGLPDTAATVDGQAYALSSIGVVAVSEGGVAVVSSPIDEDLKAVANSYWLGLGTVARDVDMAWGCADVKERRYLLGLPPSFGVYDDRISPVAIAGAYVYNVGARAWTYWPGTWRHMVRKFGGSLVAALADAPRVASQQADLGLDLPAFYADGTRRSFYCSAKYGNVLELKNTNTNGAVDVSGISVGDGFYVQTQAQLEIAPQSVFLLVTAVSLSGGNITVADASGVSANTSLGLLYKGYECLVEWVPMSLGGPAHSQANTVILHTDKTRFYAGTVRVRTELDQQVRTAKTLSRYGFGQSSFGSTPWGEYSGVREERCAVPANSQRGALHSVSFRCREAGAYWRILGLHFGFNANTEKGQR